jgi:Meckel syndrome type 1 protein
VNPLAPVPSDLALEAALDELFAAPFPAFVEERKRLVGRLRASGHRTAAAALAKVNRPTLASWAINQLVQRAPAEVSAMFASAARVRLGDFAASAEHRQTIARLSALATELLREHAQPTSEATLRRITTSLAALSAYGDFAPDAPGRMIADRDPPGFEAMALGEGSPGAGLPLTLPVATRAPASEPAGPPPRAPASAATAASASASGDPSAALLAQLAASSALSAKPAAEAAEAPPRRPPSTAPMLRLVPPPAPEQAAPSEAADAATAADAAHAAQAAADAEATAASEAAELAVAEAAAALAAAKAAAARVHRARQRAVLEELRTRQRRTTSSIFDHEQAIALMQRELEQRQAQLRTARHDAESLQAEIDRLTLELVALE